MRLLVDENVPQKVVVALQERYDVLDLKLRRRGLRDSSLIQLAKEQRRVILTCDKDFLTFHKQLGRSFGVVVINYRSRLPTKYLLALLNTLNILEEKLRSTFLQSAVHIRDGQVQIYT